MTDSLTLKELVHRVAEKDDPATIREVTNQVQHWVKLSLFEYVGFRRRDQAVGRGKLRRYPVEFVYWLKLFRVLAHHRLGHEFMQITMAAIGRHRKEARSKGEADLISAAISGEYPAVYLVVYLPALGKKSAPIKIWTHPVHINPQEECAVVLNLTQIFSDVRV